MSTTRIVRLFGGRVQIPRGTLILIVTCASCTIAAAHTPFDAWLVLAERTLPDLRLSALVLSTFVEFDRSPLGLIILVFITGYFLKDELRWLFYQRPKVLGALALGLTGAALLLDALVFADVGIWGLLTALLLLLWFGPVQEKRWGERRLLFFAFEVALVSNLVGGLLLWSWPASIGALFGSDFSSVIGTHPLIGALMTIWCLREGPARLAILNIEAYKLVYFLIGLGAFDLLFRGVAYGAMGLSGIGIAWLAHRGLDDPYLLVDHLRLARLRWRHRRMRAKFKVVQGGRDETTLH